jgi:hypothetical protein
VLLDAPSANGVKRHAGGEDPRDAQHEEPCGVGHGAWNGERHIEPTDATDQHAGRVKAAEHVVHAAHAVRQSEPNLYEPRRDRERPSDQVWNEPCAA